MRAVEYSPRGLQVCPGLDSLCKSDRQEHAPLPRSLAKVREAPQSLHPENSIQDLELLAGPVECRVPKLYKA